MKTYTSSRIVLRLSQALVVSLTAFMAVHAFADAGVSTLASGTLTVGSDLSYPPYDYLIGSEPAGLDAEFINKLAPYLKLKPKFVDVSSANRIIGLVSNRYDVLASAVYVTPERARQIDFVPYGKGGGSLLALSHSGFAPRTPEDLCGKRVGSVKGAAWIPKLDDISKTVCVPAGRGAIDVHEYETSPEATQAVLSRAVDAQFEDGAVAQLAVRKLDGRIAITSTTQIYPYVIGLGVRKGNDALRTQLEAALTSIKQSGEYQAVLKRYNVAEPTSNDIAKAIGTVTD